MFQNSAYNEEYLCSWRFSHYLQVLELGYLWMPDIREEQEDAGILWSWVLAEASDGPLWEKLDKMGPWSDP